MTNNAKISRLESKFLGGMIGSAIGDAVGELAFGYPEKESLISLIDRLDSLIYTDDTAMSIGLAESICRMNGIDQQDIGETLRRNFEREPWRGYAQGPPAIFRMVKNCGSSYTEAARSLFGGTGSLGNGAAMRIVPVGLFFHKSKELYEKACASAMVTHAHPVGIDGAAVQAFAVAQATKLDHGKEFPYKEFIQALINFSRTQRIKEKMILVQTLLCEGASHDIAARRLGSTVAVDESMPFAIYSFIRNSGSFTDCLFCAVLNGGDRDTLGAMAGAISGAYLGINAIPESWRQKLENLKYIEELALKLIPRHS